MATSFGSEARREGSLMVAMMSFAFGEREFDQLAVRAIGRRAKRARLRTHLQTRQPSFAGGLIAASFTATQGSVQRRAAADTRHRGADPEIREQPLEATGETPDLLGHRPVAMILVHGAKPHLFGGFSLQSPPA